MALVQPVALIEYQALAAAAGDAALEFVGVREIVATGRAGDGIEPVGGQIEIVGMVWDGDNLTKVTIAQYHAGVRKPV